MGTLFFYFEVKLTEKKILLEGKDIRIFKEISMLTDPLDLVCKRFNEIFVCDNTELIISIFVAIVVHFSLLELLAF